MSETIFNGLARKFSMGDVDHPDMQEVDDESAQYGVDSWTGRSAFFAGRDLKTLVELEKLEGGDGSEAQKVNLKDLAEATLSRGDKRK